MFYNRFLTKWDSDIYEDYDKLNDTIVKKYKITIPKEIQEVVCFKSGKPKVLDENELYRFIDSVGKINIREITAFAFANKCQRIIITHSHTNEKCMPSNDDLIFTKTVMLSCLLNDIDILDHVIIARNSASSFAELNLINGMKEEVINNIPSVIANYKEKQDLKYVIHD